MITHRFSTVLYTHCQIAVLGLLMKYYRPIVASGQSKLVMTASNTKLGPPDQYNIPWAARSRHPKQDLDPGSGFCRAQARVTDRQTD